MAARDLSRRRVDSGVADLQQVRVVESARARPSRDLREFSVADSAGSRAVPRGGRIGPTPGDTVPELRVDPMNLPPPPAPRPSYDERNGSATRGAERRSSPPSDRTQTGQARATDVRSPRREPSRAEEGAAAGAVVRRTEPRPADPTRATAPTDRNADHEVLGRFFRPLSEPQARSRPDRTPEKPTPPPSREETRPRQDEERARPRSDASEGRGDRGDSGARATRSAPREERTPPARVEPKQSEPTRPAPRTEHTEHAAPRPQKQDRDNRKK
jgi:hypothetical protein